MKTMVILTDFSDEAFRAAEYACEIAECLHVKKIILYNSYMAVMAYGGSPDAAALASEDHEQHLESLELLGLWQDRLKPLVAKEVVFELVTENTGIPGIAQWIEQRKLVGESGLLILGVSNKSGFEKLLNGSTTKEVLEKNEWPVLIVPETTLIGRGIKTIVFASDLKQVNNIPSAELIECLNAFPSKLHVLNIEKEKKDEVSPERENAMVLLHEMLDAYDPEFNYRTGSNVVEEIISFASIQKASMLITIHKKHGFWQRLFNESVTRKLAGKTTIPLLSLPGLR